MGSLRFIGGRVCERAVLISIIYSLLFIAAEAAGGGQRMNHHGRYKKAFETQGDALDRLFRNKYGLDDESSEIDRSNDYDLDDGYCYHYLEESKAGGGGLREEELMLMMKQNDRMVSLPGQPAGVKFDQYGGYVTVDGKAGRALYYYLVEAERKPESAPLVLWLNGGPGCSSLAYGAMQELGPFRVNSDGKTLYRNKYAWNRVANLLFVESPAGVGFSYSNRTSDLEQCGDRRTARDSLVFLLRWMERFPEYKGREFFVSGESYAGHYVPELAHVILQHNSRAKEDNAAKGGSVVINLKGVMIGNGVINEGTDDIGMYDYWWTHALISDELRDAVKKSCNFSSDLPLSKACVKAQDDANQVAGMPFDLDIYNIYAPVCHSDQPITSQPIKPPEGGVIDPCGDYYVIDYMNRAEVQLAMHANVSGHIRFRTWQPCGFMGRWTDSPDSMLPLLRAFIHAGVRVLVFSGDTDGRVPVTSTRYSLTAMNLPITTKWRAWYSNDQEVAGYTQVYQANLTFSTVRGAGHQVPSYQPARALTMITHFLNGTPLPPKNPPPPSSP